MEELVKKNFPFLFKDTFSTTKVPPLLGGSFIPLRIIFCNGEFGFSFNEATIAVMGYPGRRFEYRRESFDSINIYYGLFYDLVFNDMLTGVEELETRRKQMFENLGKFLTNERHSKCLVALYREGKDEKENVLQEVLAVHLFGPLLENADVRLDSRRYQATDKVKCKYCGTRVRKANTSFGNSAVWHGHGDMLLGHSVVTIEPGGLEEEESTLSDRLEDYPDTDEPAPKIMRVTASDVDGNSVQDTTLNDTINEEKQGSSVYLPNGPGEIPFKLEDLKECNKTLSKVLAQTITNAFLQLRLHPFLKHQFIPSFLATNNYVTIHMYNPTDDILLTQGQAMPIVSPSGKIQHETILSIWLALNMFQFSKFWQSTSLHDGLDEESKQKKSNFQQQIRAESLTLYLKKLQMPLRKSESQKMTYKEDYEVPRNHVLGLLKKLEDGVAVE